MKYVCKNSPTTHYRRVKETLTISFLQAKKKKKEKKKHKHKHKHKHSSKDKSKEHKDKDRSLTRPPSSTEHLKIKEETRETLSSFSSSQSPSEDISSMPSNMSF